MSEYFICEKKLSVPSMNPNTIIFLPKFILHLLHDFISRGTPNEPVVKIQNHQKLTFYKTGSDPLIDLYSIVLCIY